VLKTKSTTKKSRILEAANSYVGPRTFAGMLPHFVQNFTDQGNSTLDPWSVIDTANRVRTTLVGEVGEYLQLRAQ